MEEKQRKNDMDDAERAVYDALWQEGYMAKVRLSGAKARFEVAVLFRRQFPPNCRSPDILAFAEACAEFFPTEFAVFFSKASPK